LSDLLLLMQLFARGTPWAHCAGLFYFLLQVLSQSSPILAHRLLRSPLLHCAPAPPAPSPSLHCANSTSWHPRGPAAAEMRKRAAAQAEQEAGAARPSWHAKACACGAWWCASMAPALRIRPTLQ